MGHTATGTVLVGEHDGLDAAVERRRHVDALPRQQPSRIGNALRGVVVAGNHDRRNAGIRHALEEPVHKRHSLRAGL
jgi:hypothetical protein